MDKFRDVTAMVIPSGQRMPRLVAMPLSPMVHLLEPYHAGDRSRQVAWMPHPEVFMDHIAEVGATPWKFQLVEALDGMTKKFATPYVIFYPTISRDGMAFPINQWAQEIQGKAFKESHAWRGDLVVTKYRDDPFTSLKSISMADYIKR